MKGVVIWGWVRCRSVMGVFREMAKSVPVRMALWREGMGLARELQGHSADEFADVPAVFVGDDWEKASRLFEETAGWVQLVCPYQVSPLARRVAIEGKRRGDVVGVVCEAPWNAQGGVKAVIWEIYLRTVLRWRVRSVTACADFLACYSGEDDHGTARSVGWAREKIFPFGYFPPPVLGSRRVARAGIGGRRVKILALATKGRMCRGEDVVRCAAAILGGERYELVMPDFIGMDAAVTLYETCDIFVAAGYNEPWGMRVNDALNCGMPFVVSDGMGARKLAAMTGAGLSFRAGDARDLASKIRAVERDYAAFAKSAFAAGGVIAPAAGAKKLLEIVSRFAGGGATGSISCPSENRSSDLTR